VAPAAAATSASDSVGGWARVDALLGRIRPPVFPARRFAISDFGARPGGRDLCSAAIAAAISACRRAGGGRVVIPAGEWLTGTIGLSSGIELHLEAGAVLRFSTDPRDYRPLVPTRWEGVECIGLAPLIHALGAEDVAVTGEGILDGQAGPDNWWRWKGLPEFGWQSGQPHQGPVRARLLQMAEEGVPVERRVVSEDSCLRPAFIQFNRCRRILVEGVTIHRAPMWALHPVLCTGVTVRRVTVASRGPNNDGCDIESCRDVLIEDCTFDTGDDCVAIKSGRNADGRRLGVPSEDIVVRRCRMHDGHGGVVIGSEVSGGCRNVFVEECAMSSPNLERALRIKTNSHRGGVVEDIYLRHVAIGEVSDAVLRVNFFYEEGDGGNHTPVVRNIHLEHIRSERSRYALVLAGYERSPVRGVHLRDCHFNHVECPSVLHHVADLRLDDAEIQSGGTLDAAMLSED
jgi:polygalacturonase